MASLSSPSTTSTRRGKRRFDPRPGHVRYSPRWLGAIAGVAAIGGLAMLQGGPGAAAVLGAGGALGAAYALLHEPRRPRLERVTLRFPDLAAGLDGLRIQDLRHTAVALWIAAGASPKEVAVLAGHTSVSFTLDRYGHLYPDSYATLRDRLDALHESVQVRDAEVIDLSTTVVRPQRGRNMR